MKLKRTFSLLLTLMLVAGCDETEEPKEEEEKPEVVKTYAQYNEDQHKVYDSSGMVVFKNHVFEVEEIISESPFGDDIKQTQKVKCALCDYEKERDVVHKHDYEKELKYDETYHWEESKCTHEDQHIIKNKVEHMFGEWTVHVPEVDDPETEEVEDGEFYEYRDCRKCDYRQKRKMDNSDFTEEKTVVGDSLFSGYSENSCTTCDDVHLVVESSEINAFNGATYDADRGVILADNNSAAEYFIELDNDFEGQIYLESTFREYNENASFYCSSNGSPLFEMSVDNNNVGISNRKTFKECGVTKEENLNVTNPTYISVNNINLKKGSNVIVLKKTGDDNFGIKSIQIVGQYATEPKEEIVCTPLADVLVNHIGPSQFSTYTMSIGDNEYAKFDCSDSEIYADMRVNNVSDPDKTYVYMQEQSSPTDRLFLVWGSSVVDNKIQNYTEYKNFYSIAGNYFTNDGAAFNMSTFFNVYAFSLVNISKFADRAKATRTTGNYVTYEYYVKDDYLEATYLVSIDVHTTDDLIYTYDVTNLLTNEKFHFKRSGSDGTAFLEGYDDIGSIFSI